MGKVKSENGAFIINGTNSTVTKTTIAISIATNATIVYVDLHWWIPYSFWRIFSGKLCLFRYACMRPTCTCYTIYSPSFSISDICHVLLGCSDLLYLYNRVCANHISDRLLILFYNLRVRHLWMCGFHPMLDIFFVCHNRFYSVQFHLFPGLCLLRTAKG